ncbi:MAG: insulinase family protein [Gammaproteobacteria bacterium]|jgi:zinc protease|nr:insulinase family protein [Gammaproteobacteria bacterium]
MHMLRTTLASALLCPLLAWSAPAIPVDIPYTVRQLDNGLTVVVHEDHKAPIVAVNVWYHVGSKNEAPGRTGFAHLFEHLMFQGSENLKGEYLNTLQELGATDLNGTTFFDRTNYFQTVPRNALDTALWLESDRMGHFRGAITQAKLDEQRGVVQNEKRQGDNQPYGKVFEMILRQLFPPDHPYSWETIGSMEDLNAASLDDVRRWFETWYGPNNAVIVIAGDVDTEEAFAKAEKYFGDIPPGPAATRLGEWIPAHAQPRRQEMQDRVAQARIYMAWTGPRWGARDAHQLELAAAVLAGDKNSRLYQRLVYKDQLATDVEFGTLALEISGITYLQASAQPGVSLAQIESAIDEELERFRREGPTAKELERVKVQQRAAFLRGIEKVGGFSGKSGVLAESMVYGGRPDAWKQSLEDGQAATAAELAAVLRKWVTKAPFVLEVTPAPELRAAAAGADRSTMPMPVGETPVSFPAFERATLGNGLKLIVVERPGVPVVDLRLLLDAGFAADQFARPGTANLTMAMLDEGTKTRDALQISEQLALLGASLGASSGLDSSSVNLSALADKLDPSLELFADVILNPVFPDKELERVRKTYLAALSQEKTQPTSMALRVLPKLLFGTGHAYAQPLTGTGTEATLKALGREDLARFHQAWFRPDHATLIAVGPVSVASLKPKLEQLFRNWQPGDIPAKRIGEVTLKPGKVLYLVDKPGAEQSVIFAGQLIPPRATTDDIAIEAMNDVLGGQFTARLNMNLRENKHWSYGAYSMAYDARGQRPLLAYAAVQSDKTAESLGEIRKEITELATSRPATAEEVALVKRSNTLSLPGQWETGSAVLGSISKLVEFGLPDTYWTSYADAVRSLTPAQVNQAARDYLQPGNMVFVVVGDRKLIEPGLKALGFDSIQLVDTDGELL